jgi:hypothetical protein
VAELASPSSDLSRKDLDRFDAVPRGLPAVKPPLVESVVDAKGALSLPAKTTATAAKSALTVEGPPGSFSILAERVAEPADLHAVTVAVAAPPVESDPLTAGLRAFAANFLAEYRKDFRSPASQAACRGCSSAA